MLIVHTESRHMDKNFKKIVRRYRVTKDIFIASSIFSYLSSYIYYFHVIQKNQANNLIFECVREKLFLSRFIVTTLYIH